MKKTTLLKFLGTIIASTLVISNANARNDLPNNSELREALQSVLGAEVNGGGGLNFWGVVVDRDGVVRSVAFSGQNRSSQLPIARVVAATKANTVNALGVNSFVFSNGQLFSSVQEGNAFQSIIDVSPVSDVVHRGPAKFFGTRKDPMIGNIVGGVTTIPGGLALFNDYGQLIGAIAVAGELQPCADHNAAWIMRDALGLDNLPDGVGISPTGDDNIIYDIDENGNSASGFGSLECSPATTAISESLPVNFPIGQ